VGAPAAGWTVGSGSWTVATDGTQVLKQTSTNTSQADVITAAAGPWSSYAVTAQVKPGTTASGTSNVLSARNRDANNHYSLILKDGSTWVFGKKVNGVFTNFGTGTFRYDTATWQTLEIDLCGSQLAAKINGSVVSTATDTAFSSGGIQFSSRYVLEVDNVTVAPLSGPVPTPTPTPSPSSPPPPTPTPAPTATPTPGGPPGTVAGSVQDVATGSPIAGASVTTSPAGGSATTDGLGGYSLSAPPGTYDVIITASGYNANFVGAVAVTSGATSTANQALVAVPAQTNVDLFSRPDSPGPGLGTASDGHPWANDLAVYPQGAATISDRQAFVKTAQAFTDHDTWMGQSYQNVEVTVDLQMTNVAFDPSYQHGARLLARVQGNDIWVLVAINPTNDSLTLWTDNHGSWNQFATASVSLTPGTWYHTRFDVIGNSVSAKVWAFGTAEPGWQITGTQNTLTGAGQAGLRTTVSDTYYQNFRATALTGVAGQVKDSATGQPVPGATVTLSTGASTTTDASGNYVFTGLGAGGYTVTASAAGYATHPSSSFNVAAGTTATVNLSF
jgi:hypothetical protein